MTPALLSIIGLIFVIFLSLIPRVNPGILGLALAWMIGFHFNNIAVTEILAGFPISIFIILLGVTFLFAIAQTTGALENITRLCVTSAGANTFTAPVIFFLLALGLSTLGAGNVGAVALLAPLALNVGHKLQLSGFFMSVMLINGANAGTFSPFAFTGIIADGLSAELGYTMSPWSQIYLPSLLAQSFIALASYIIFISLRKKNTAAVTPVKIERRSIPWTRQQILATAAIVLFVFGILIFKFDTGFWAIALSGTLILLNTGDSKKALQMVPWDTIIMVCGVSTLIHVVELTGGINFATSMISKIADGNNVYGVIAFLSGGISAFSSSSGVVMPSFIPMVPQLVEKLGAEAIPLIASINIGTHVVDVSPLSTLGALCLASAAGFENKDRLFRQLLAYGLSMSFLGALVCQIFFGNLDLF